MKQLCSVCVHQLEIVLQWYEIHGADRNAHISERLCCTVSGEDLGYTLRGVNHYRDEIFQCMEFQDKY